MQEVECGDAEFDLKDGFLVGNTDLSQSLRKVAQLIKQTRNTIQHVLVEYLSAKTTSTVSRFFCQFRRLALMISAT
jgi:hypothetical protein